MSTTATEATEVYVSCEKFCGARITLAGDAGAVQHFEGCGATADDLKALDDALTAKRIHVAAAAEAEELDEELPADETPAAKFVCKCKEPFETWELLGAHQTATGHEGCATDENDALDDDALEEREQAETVDGVAAKIKHGTAPKGPKIEKVDYSHLWRDPLVSHTDIISLQRKIDDGEFTIGGIAAGKACIGKTTAVDPSDGATVEVGCPHKCFARKVRKNECDLEHTHSETLEQVCLIHAISSWGGDVPPAGNGPLFGPNA